MVATEEAGETPQAVAPLQNGRRRRLTRLSATAAGLLLLGWTASSCLGACVYVCVGRTRPAADRSIDRSPVRMLILMPLLCDRSTHTAGAKAVAAPGSSSSSSRSSSSRSSGTTMGRQGLPSATGLDPLGRTGGEQEGSSRAAVPLFLGRRRGGGGGSAGRLGLAAEARQRREERIRALLGRRGGVQHADDDEEEEDSEEEEDCEEEEDGEEPPSLAASLASLDFSLGLDDDLPPRRRPPSLGDLDLGLDLDVGSSLDGSEEEEVEEEEEEEEDDVDLATAAFSASGAASEEGREKEGTGAGKLRNRTAEWEAEAAWLTNQVCPCCVCAPHRARSIHCRVHPYSPHHTPTPHIPTHPPTSIEFTPQSPLARPPHQAHPPTHPPTTTGTPLPNAPRAFRRGPGEATRRRGRHPL
jgi:hypothetical protein